jgi:hypothetical protein
VRRQLQVLTIHVVALAKPLARPVSKRTGRCLSNEHVFPAVLMPLAEQEATGRHKGGIMHPMFVKLYLEAEADDDQDKRRRTNRVKRNRSRAAVRITARDRDRRPRR